MLATLGDLKDRLGVIDDGQDSKLSFALSTASSTIAERCHYSEAAALQLVETLRSVQQGREYRLGTRLVDETTHPFLVEGRGQGADAFQTLAHDLIDPTEGVYMILGSADWWPPVFQTEQRRQKFRRWREPIWPVVRVTYDVSGIGSGADAPQQLQDAAISLAIYWLGQSQAGAVSKVTIGQLSQTIEQDPFPSFVRSMLGKHYRGSGATWVR